MSGPTRVGDAVVRSPWQTIRHGLSLSPEITTGAWLTLLVAAVATAGRVVIPIAVQQTIDKGLNAPGGVDLTYVRWMVAASVAALVITVAASYVMNVRISKASESGLATLRAKAFRHIHDLSVQTQDAERRGSLVSRVSSDVDTISHFLSWGGLIIFVSVGQIAIATVVMAVYSWQLTVLVWVCFLPLFVILRRIQIRLAAAFMAVREKVGAMLSAISEAVVGSRVVRAYAIEERTRERIDTAIEDHRLAATRAHKFGAIAFSSSEIAYGIVNAAIVIAGVFLGIAGDITAGRLVAFLFLVTLFVMPLQAAAEVLNEAQNAVAGWRRVLGIIDTPADVLDPGDGTELPSGPLNVSVENVSYAYPGGPAVLHDVTVEIPAGARVAIVGETGSGKSTFAKLVARLMDPASGRITIGGVDLREVMFSSLRERVGFVVQEGFLFDSTVAENIRYGNPSATDDELRQALAELGLIDWVESLTDGLATPVGQRGESLSAGERQLVAIARAYVANTDVLVLDEATSAVDPATEVRVARALEGLSRGRTSLTIAHRLSTAEAADEVLVFDNGVLVEHGPHSQLVCQEGVYARLHAAWTAGSRGR